MKKLIAAAVLFYATAAYGQCVITGKSSIGIAETETYSLQNDNAQCKDCHLWVTVGGNSTLQTDNKLNTVTLKGTSGGRTILSATILTPAGIEQCSKTIDVAPSNSTTPAAKENPNCDIDVNDFKEVKYADGIVSFFPSQTSKEYKYNWTVTYFNGDQKSSSEKVPQFPYSKANSIQKVSLKITDVKCIRTFSKTYENNYWTYF